MEAQASVFYFFYKMVVCLSLTHLLMEDTQSQMKQQEQSDGVFIINRYNYNLNL